MIKFFVFLGFILICNGCASGSKSSSVVLEEKVVKNDRLTKYASNMGCKMLKSGYMVCPKTMNR